MQNLDSGVLINAFTLAARVPSPVCGLSRGSYAHPAVIYHVREPPRVRQRVADWFCAIRAALPIVSTQKSKQQAPRRSHYGARFHAPLLIDACVIAPQQGGAPGSLSHHSNNPIESAGGRGMGGGVDWKEEGPHAHVH